MANATADDWDITAPDTDADDASAGAKEIRLLREGVADRINKEHVTLAGSGAGGEHLEGSARIHTATSAPTTIVAGGSVNIAGNEALSVRRFELALSGLFASGRRDGNRRRRFYG